MPYLEVLNGPEVGTKTPLTQDTFFVGRDPNNHLLLSDRTVSRKHAVINHLEGKYVITDLKSLKGILVNGVKKEEASLEHGDEIAVGAVRLRFYGDAEKEKALFPLKRTKKGGKLLSGLFLFLILAGGGLYLWKGRGISSNPADLNALREHYERGVELFNVTKDKEGAKKEFKKVLELDPKRKTSFAEKASKLLENL